ncbi:integrase [Mesorhizobium sangaii]|uniref:Integrase n=1 Tax=Mesorhizobium sangaii TaxID=505389 RepID=A0A841PBU1_9HYPH|nr:integrase [Mesorhizobium sangaii]
MRWRHIADGKVTVETRVDAFGEFDTTKSDAGVRTVPMSKALSEELAAKRKASEHSSDEDFVFPDAFGNFTRHTNFTKRKWKPILEKAEAGMRCATSRSAHG